MYDVIDAVWRQQKQLLKIAGPSYVPVFHVFTSGLRIKSLSDTCQSWNGKRWMYTLSVAWIKMRFFHVFHSQHNPVFFQPVFSLTVRRKKKTLCTDLHLIWELVLCKKQLLSSGITGGQKGWWSLNMNNDRHWIFIEFFARWKSCKDCDIFRILGGLCTANIQYRVFG